MNEPLSFTGERFIPGTRGEIWIEHWHRYHFARHWVSGRQVLDVACGEGYGSALLAREASHVTGVDVSAEAIAHARREYAAIGNARFEIAPCTQLPLADASVDVAVSFETLEHIDEQERFLDELARVLRPDGLLILSCPNRLEYRDRRGFENPYHVKELYRDELAKLLAERFPHCAWYGQRPSFFSVIAPEAPGRVEGHIAEVTEADPSNDSRALENPLYFVVVASRDATALASVSSPLSVLADRDDWVHRDYEKVMRDLQVTVARGEALERQVADRERSVGTLQDEIRTLVQTGNELRQALEERDVALSRREAEVASRDEMLATKDREILRRRSLRWWLRLPLVRMGVLKE